MPKTIQQAEQDVLAAARAYDAADKEYSRRWAANREMERGNAARRMGLPLPELLPDTMAAVLALHASREEMQAAAKALVRADAGNPIAKVGSDPTYRYGKGAPCVDEIERDAATREG